MNLFEKNLKRWSLFHPKEAEKLAALGECKRIRLHTNENGISNLSFDVDGKTYYFHSPEDPISEANKWFSDLDLTGVSVIYVYGIGLGYYYDAAVNWLRANRNNFLVFIEDDLEVLHHFLETEKANLILYDQQVWVSYLGGDVTALDSLTAIFVMKEYKVTALDFYRRTREIELSYLKSKIGFYIHLREGSYIEYSDHGRNFFRNFYRNIMLLPQASQGTGMFGRFKDIPAIICGAGPSLGKNIEVLSTLRDKAIIFAGGTAMNALNATGFLPHFGVGIDPNPAQYTRLIMNQAYAVPFFYRNRLLHQALKTVHGDHLYIAGSTGYDISEWFENNVNVLRTDISEGCNVINFSLAIAHAMGCNPILFVGLDLAYTDSRSYAPGILNHPLHERREYFRTKSSDEELINRNDIHGQPVFTLWKWIAESLWFSNFARLHSGRIFINATEGGIGFTGIPNVPLSIAAEKLLTKQWDFEGMIHAEIQNYPMPPEVTDEAIKQNMETLAEGLKRCEVLCAKIQEDFEETSVKIRADQPVPSDFLSAKGSEALEALKKEPAYRYLLKTFDENFLEMYKRDYERLTYDRDMLGEKESNLKKTNLDATCYGFLKETAKANYKLIEEVLKEFGDLKRQALIRTQKNEGPPLDTRKGDVNKQYSYEEGRLIICDPELGINIEESFQPDSMTGIQKEYYENGGVRSICYYIGGLLHGPSVYFSADGNRVSQAWFYKGKKQGEARTWHSNHALGSICRWKDGLRHGKQEYYYSDGTYKTVLSYDHDKLNGEVLLYYPNGQKKRELHFEQGKRMGMEQLWNEVGMLIMEASWNMDVPVGTARSWYNNGNIAKEVIFDKETRKMTLREWDEGGFPRLKEQQVTGDYFDMVARQTDQLTLSLEQVFHQVASVSPLIDQALGKFKGIKSDHLDDDIKSLKSEIEHLHEVSNKLLFETGLDPANTEEMIWKSPSSQREVEKQIGLMSKDIAEGMNLIQDALLKTVGMLNLKIAMVAEEEANKSKGEEQKKKGGGEGDSKDLKEDSPS